MSLKENTNCQVVVIRQQNYSTEQLQGLRCTGLRRLFAALPLAVVRWQLGKLKSSQMHRSGNFPPQ